ncbi:hypothetical protein G3R49_18970 [Shewanella sp. WXL01]|uniref:hypothetical protein n=1 Tax=Shewanella sp. WXL01 TaxID=2709721 RepID=UPI0014384FC3|nr:hypothetical protein [Shewanella sp. WXL01]NKF52643.1 hypothetical protein [Shewanella sp. WXL01]
MYLEPWSDINEYPESHKNKLSFEAKTEIDIGHILFGKELSVITKREDCDEILILSGSNKYIVHLTWSSNKESPPYPNTVKFDSEEELERRLQQDFKFYS